MISDRDIGWVAGLIEGEGCIGVFKNGGKSIGKSARITVAMTDKDIIDRLHSVTGLGWTADRRPTNPNHQHQYKWTVSTQSEMLQLLYLVFPLLGERKQLQATAAINHILSSPGRGNWKEPRKNGYQLM